MNVKTDDLHATLARLRREGKRIASVSVGKRNGDWIVSVIEETLRQEGLDFGEPKPGCECDLCRTKRGDE